MIDWLLTTDDGAIVMSLLAIVISVLAMFAGSSRRAGD